MTKELNGRRINFLSPTDSLVLQKALGEVPHTGGQRLEADSAQCQIVLSWIAAGAPADPPEAPVPVGIDVFPDEAVFVQRGGTQQLVVRAR